MKDEDQTKFYDLVDEIARLCHERGEISMAEIERMALEKDVRPSAVLEQLTVSDFYVSFSEGKVKCR